MRHFEAKRQEVTSSVGWFVWLMAVALGSLTACQNSTLPQTQSPFANIQEESASVQEERTETAEVLVPAAGVSRPLAAAPDSAASAPQPSVVMVSDDYAVRWLLPLLDRDENDGVEIIDHGWLRGVQLVVTSKSGSGAVEVQPMGTGWPRQVQVQFQYASGKPFDELERLYLQAINPVALAGDQESDPEPPNGFAVWQRDGAMRVDLPAGWLHARQKLHMAWSDRIRPLLVTPDSSKTPFAE